MHLTLLSNKKYNLGVSLIEVVLVMLISLSLFDIINMGLNKSKELNTDTARSVYMLKLKKYIENYMQSLSKTDFCQIKSGSKNTCAEIKSVSLKDIISKSEYSSLPETERNNTYILLKNESVSTSTKVDPINYLSALAFILPNNKILPLDVQRAAALTGSQAGLFNPNTSMISNGNKTFKFPRSDWLSSNNKVANKIDSKTSIIYLPSGLVNMISLKTGPLKLNNIKLVKEESGISSSCQVNTTCNWKGLYTSDKLKISWEPSQSTDYVDVKMTEADDSNTIWFSSAFYNTHFLSFPADSLWYNNKSKLITLTPYSSNSKNSHGNSIKIKLNVQAPVMAKNDSEARNLLPFNINFKFKSFLVDANNKHSSAADYKIIFPQELNIYPKKNTSDNMNKLSSDNIIYTYVKPVVIKFAFLIHYQDTTTGKVMTRTLELHTFSVKDSFILQYLPDMKDLESLLNATDRTAIKLDKNTIDITPTIQLYWGYKQLLKTEFKFDKINFAKINDNNSIDLKF